MPKWNRKFAGEWRIIELPDMGDDYMEEGEGKPYIRLKARYEDVVDGEYECGLTNGVIDGAVRSFGGERIVVFGFDLKAWTKWKWKAGAAGCASATMACSKASSSTTWGSLWPGV
jgi:hypothetical protein